MQSATEWVKVTTGHDITMGLSSSLIISGGGEVSVATVPSSASSS